MNEERIEQLIKEGASSELRNRIEEEFLKGMMCSQLTFAHGAEQQGLESDIACRIGASFGWGMLHGERCGAVTGAMMALGLKYGKANSDDPNNNRELRDKVRIIEKAVKERYGSYYCKEILGANYGDKAGRDAISKEARWKNCPEITAFVCELLDEIMKP